MIDANGHENEMESELLKRELLPGREALYAVDGREVLLFRCSECGYTLEAPELEADFICPLCDSGMHHFIETNYRTYPVRHVNQPWAEGTANGEG